MHVHSILAANENNSSPFTFVIFLLIPVAMYFLLIRPQRKRMRDQAALQSAIGIGDEVMTTSGMYGFITGFDGDIVWLEVDDNIQIRISRAAVQRKVDTAGGDSTAPGGPELGAGTTDEPAGGDANKN